MSSTQFVKYRGHGFWAYDVALGIFLKHLIDVAEQRATSPNDEWLAKAVSWWRIVACVTDYGLDLDETWNTAQMNVFLDLADEACNLVAQREMICADEIKAWPILDDLRIFPRGATEVHTAAVVELGRAMIALVTGSLPSAPAGTLWLYGTPAGRVTIRCANPSEWHVGPTND